MSPNFLSLIAAAFLVPVVVGMGAETCDIMEFHRCVGQIGDFADGYAFHVTSVSELMESCEAKLEAVRCSNDYISRCMERNDKEMFRVTTGGKLKLVEELCTDGTDIHREYVENFDCWRKIANDTLFCNEQFEKSQKILVEEDLIERLRMFYSCCSFDWHKKCKTKAAEAKCNPMAREFLDDVATQLGGRVLSQLCEASFSNCLGLYGVDVEDLDERYSRETSTSSMTASSIVSTLLSIVIVVYF